MTAPFHAAIRELTARYRTKQLSPVEIVESHLNRASSLQPKLNAFVHLDAEHTLVQARSATESLTRTEPHSLGLLPGVPITVKSCIDVAGWPCPAGSLLRKDYIANADAPLVARLKSAGAILIGNTNTPEFLMAYETGNRLTGKTSNPWSLDHSAGGSSGGESSAIASGCSMGGVGSDGGGSIRVPAHFCGICGLKPTPGRIPGTGHFPAGLGAFSWLGVVGPMARTVDDLRLLFEVMAGPDPGDPQCVPASVQYPTPEKLRGLRVGILESEALGKATPETQAAVQTAAKLLAASGFTVEPFRLNGLDAALELWWFFFGPAVAHLYQPLVAGKESLLSPQFQEYLDVASQAAPLDIDSFLAAGINRDLCRANILAQLQDIPILLSPVCATPAFRHGEGTWHGPNDYRSTMRFSQWLSVLGFPGVTVPVSFTREGLPIGVQIIGRPYEDELVLAVAQSLEHARGPWKFPATPLP
jgi:Asp-tRNA(Asn)/Glu-tRNA(Gln) amidotransferase A subunit family amidase